jgi:hypothetical protein
MVKLQTSLLAVTLATGSALACGYELQRREVGPASNLHLRFGLACARHDNLQTRGSVDEDDLFVRDDAFDDVEARAFGASSASGLFSFGKKIFESKQAKEGVKHLSTIFRHGKRISEHKNTRHGLKAFDTASQVYDGVQTMNSRDLEDNEDLFVRDLDAFDDLEAREPAGGSMKAVSDAWRFGKMLSEHKNTKHLMTAVDVGTQAYGAYQMVKSRGLEDDEDMFERDVDTEELFGREYDLLDERDTFDDLD